MTHYLEKGDPRVIHRIELPYCEEHWKGVMSFYCAEHPFSRLADDWKVKMLKPEVLEHIYRLREYVCIIDMAKNRVVDMVPYWEYDPGLYYEDPDEDNGR